LQNWKFPEGLPCDGFIVQHPVEDCWDGLGTFFFMKRNFLLVPLPEAKLDMGLFQRILLGYSIVHELMETVWLEQVQLFIQLAI
jgi:hypothetical protein